MNAQTTSHPYSLKGCKTFTGREGIGLNATLYHGDRKVAFVIDDASGGMTRFQWMGSAEHQQADAAALDAYCATLPRWSAADMGGRPDETYAVDRDYFVNMLLADYEGEKQARADLRRKIVFIADGKLKAAKAAPTPANLAAFQQQRPDAKVLNTLPVHEAVAAYRAQLVTA